MLDRARVLSVPALASMEAVRSLGKIQTASSRGQSVKLCRLMWRFRAPIASVVNASSNYAHTGTFIPALRAGRAQACVL